MPETGANLHPKWEISMTQPADGAPETGAANTDTTGTTDPATDQTATSETDTTDWKAEAEKAKADAEKWKGLSRKNEDAYKAERDKAAKAGMTADEKATADAEAKGRKAAAQEYGAKLALAEFKAAAAAKQFDPSEILDDLNLSKYVDDDGTVDTAAITKAVAKFAKLAKPAAAGQSGGDFAGGTGAGTPITEAQLAKMSSDDIAKAYAEGKLKHLL
jgi:hypothetical protein